MSGPSGLSPGGSFFWSRYTNFHFGLSTLMGYIISLTKLAEVENMLLIRDMIMKYRAYVCLLLASLAMAACVGPVIVEESGGEQGGAEEHPDSVPIVHEGTYDSPYTVAEAQCVGRAVAVWVEGYVVGTVKGSMKSGCDYTAAAVTQANILLADTFPTGAEYDYRYCIPVELSGQADVRDELNLYDNPDIYHSKLRIQGDIKLYYSVAGMRNVLGYVDENENVNENVDENEDEDMDDNEDEDEVTDDSSKECPLSIAQGILLQDDRNYNQVWIRGYIVGYTTRNRKVYTDLTDIKVTARTNVLLADEVGETDPERMIAVELKSDSYIAKVVNLYDHPDNMHRQLTVKGRMLPWRDMYGCVEIPDGLGQLDGTKDEDYYFVLGE